MTLVANNRKRYIYNLSLNGEIQLRANNVIEILFIGSVGNFSQSSSSETFWTINLVGRSSGGVLDILIHSNDPLALQSHNPSQVKSAGYSMILVDNSSS